MAFCPAPDGENRVETVRHSSTYTYKPDDEVKTGMELIVYLAAILQPVMLRKFRRIV